VSEGRFRSARENEDRLVRKWMGRFESFDMDYRTELHPVPQRRGRPPLSVVVVTKDSLRTIARCMEDLAAATGPEDEIVVADAGSTDCTLAFVERFSAAHPGLVTVVRGAPGDDLVAAARAGHAAASRDVRVQLPSLGVHGALLNDLTALLLDRPRPPALAALQVDQAGFCAAGHRAAFAALGEAAAAALVQADPDRLEQAFAGFRSGALHLVRTRSAAA